jgi:HEAT repeat protein
MRRWLSGARFVMFLSVLVVLQGCSGLEALNPISRTRFVKPPTATLADTGQVAIAFTLAEPTDYAVFIKNADGHTVRHLAARAGGPENMDVRLTWDGCDDAGRPLPGGAYRVEVALGLTPTYETHFGDRANEIGAVHGLAVGPHGRLYVMGGTRDPQFALFETDGQYLRTILPRPSTLPLERVKPLGEVTLDNGESFPLMLLPQYGDPMRQVPVVAANGDLIFANGSMRYHAERHRFICAERMHPVWPRRLLRLASDGGVSGEGVLGPVLGKAFNKKTLYLGLSPDSETVYVSGAQHAVFKVRWGENEKPEAFIGTPGKAGKGAEGLNDPCGIALDDAGNLYVADRANHRIACFDPQGKLVSELNVEWPLQVAVHPKDGTLYAVCGYRKFKLLKFKSIQAKQPTAELALASSHPTVALAPSSTGTVVYVGNIRYGAAAAGMSSVVRLADAGDGFVESGVVTAGGSRIEPSLFGVDRVRELVYDQSNKNYGRWDGRTGRYEPIPMHQHPKSSNASEMTAGADGTVAVHVPGEMGRFDHRILPVPFASSSSFIARLANADGVLHGRDSFVAPDGTIYRIHERGGQNRPMRVSTIKSDGTPGRDSFIMLDTRSAAGIRVDRDGNVYILDHVKPLDQPVPEALKGKVKVVRHSPFVYHYGSVLKFRPEGGFIRQLSATVPVERNLEPGRKQFTTAEGRGDFVAEGVLWSWYGVSMITPALDRGRYSPYNCVCVTPRFDIDDFARVFVPDQLRCRIVVLDTDGRFITAFGRYGNIDEVGPDVPLADPRTVMVSRDAAYVGDQSNHRVVKVKLDYAERAGSGVTLPDGFAQVAVSPRVRQIRTRLAELRTEVGKFSPTLLKELNWHQLEELVNRRSTSLSLDDVRAELSIIAPRTVPGWPAKEAQALLGHYLRSESERLRVAVAWGLAGGRLGTAGEAVLKTALADRSPSVRIAAAYALLDRDNPVGMAEIFRAALSPDRDIYLLAETALLRKLLVWDSSHPLARKLDDRVALVPMYEADHEAVLALGDLLDQSKSWYFRRSAMFLLGFSGRPEAAPPLLRAVHRPERDRNLNRCLSGLGMLRHREAVPTLLKYMARGHGPKRGTLSYNGDEAERYAARSLVQIADPESVGPIITLLDSAKPEVRVLARRSLTDLFAKNVPADRCLVPKNGAFVQTRVDELPEPAELRKEWEAFWKANRANYAWPNPGPPLRAAANR